MKRSIRAALARKLDFALPPSVEMLTSYEVRRYLRVSEDTLVAWRRERRGPPFVKLTRQVIRYPIRPFKRYLREHLYPAIPAVTEAPELKGGGH
jgi:hypothetical protein